jgi:hypothetical protein
MSQPRRKRLRTKTDVTHEAHLAHLAEQVQPMQVLLALPPPPLVPLYLPCLIVVDPEPESAGPRTIYLISLAHPTMAASADGYALVKPGTFSRQQILAIARNCVEQPVYEYTDAHTHAPNFKGPARKSTSPLTMRARTYARTHPRTHTQTHAHKHAGMRTHTRPT